MAGVLLAFDGDGFDETYMLSSRESFAGREEFSGCVRGGLGEGRRLSPNETKLPGSAPMQDYLADSEGSGRTRSSGTRSEAFRMRTASAHYV